MQTYVEFYAIHSHRIERYQSKLPEIEPKEINCQRNVIAIASDCAINVHALRKTSYLTRIYRVYSGLIYATV